MEVVLTGPDVTGEPGLVDADAAGAGVLLADAETEPVEVDDWLLLDELDKLTERLVADD